MHEQFSIGELITFYRERRGLSRPQLARKLGKSVSWMTKVERGDRALDKLSVIHEIAAALGVEPGQLLGQPYSLPAREDPDGVPMLRRVLLRTETLPLPLEGVGGESLEVRQAAELRGGLEVACRRWHTDPASVVPLVGKLPRMLLEAQLAVRAAAGEQAQRDANEVLAETYRLASGVLKRLGEHDLAWISADRGIRAAEAADAPVLVAVAAFTLGHGLLGAGKRDDAATLAATAAEMLGTPDSTTPPERISIWGLLHGVGMRASAQSGDRAAILEFERGATHAAGLLGTDRYDFWLLFGPTGAGIYQVCARLELDDPIEALRRAEQLDVRHVASVERRARFHVYRALAHGQRARDSEALSALLEAEQASGDVVRYDPMARELLRDLVRRARRTRLDPQLVRLVDQARVLPGGSLN